MPVYLGNKVSLHQTLAPCRHFPYRIGSDASFPTGSDPPTDDSIRHAKQCINPPVWNENSVGFAPHSNTQPARPPRELHTSPRHSLPKRAAAVRRGRFGSCLSSPCCAGMNTRTVYLGQTCHGPSTHGACHIVAICQHVWDVRLGMRSAYGRTERSKQDRYGVSIRD